MLCIKQDSMPIIKFAVYHKRPSFFQADLFTHPTEDLSALDICSSMLSLFVGSSRWSVSLSAADFDGLASCSNTKNIGFLCYNKNFRTNELFYESKDDESQTWIEGSGKINFIYSFCLNQLPNGGDIP